MPALSRASTETAPVTSVRSTSLPWMKATALLDTLLLATTAPTALPLASVSAEALDSTALLTVALICACDSALTSRSPPTVRREPLTVAWARAGRSLANGFLTSLHLLEIVLGVAYSEFASVIGPGAGTRAQVAPL